MWSGSRVGGILLIAIVVLDLTFVAMLFSASGTIDPVVEGWMTRATQWGPALVCWFAAARTGFRRADVILAAAALSFSASGETYYAMAMGADGYLQSPSPADIGYLLFYPLMFASLVVFAKRHSSRIGRAVILDAAVASLGTAALIVAMLSPVLSDAVAGSDVGTSIVNLAYPLGDLLLIAAIAGIAASPIKNVGRRWKALVAGLIVFTGADIAYALVDNAGAYVSGTPLDATWAIGMTFIAWWVHGLAGASADTGDIAPKRMAMPVTSFGFVAGLGVLVVGTQTPVTAFALVLAAATAALAAGPVMFRQAVLSRLLADQRRVLEDVERLDRSKNEMLITMNHELRTPLTSILGYLEVVRDGDAGDIPVAANQMLGAVENNAVRMQKLIDDMLVMTRLDGGTDAADFSDVDLAGLFADVETTVEHFAATRGVSVEFRESEPEMTVAGDREQLQRAFTNLVENAIKFTPKGGSVAVAATRADDRDGAATIATISDTGMGIPSAEIPQLGTRLFRASNACSSAVPGAGLGLAIAREIVLAHGGGIVIESTLDKGTAVHVRLPALVSSR
jgi:signal transduction histidine kinase